MSKTIFFSPGVIGIPDPKRPGRGRWKLPLRSNCDGRLFWFGVYGLVESRGCVKGDMSEGRAEVDKEDVFWSAESGDQGLCVEEKGELGEDDAVEVAGVLSMLADRAGKVATERPEGEVEVLRCVCPCGVGDRVGVVCRGLSWLLLLLVLASMVMIIVVCCCYRGR